MFRIMVLLIIAVAFLGSCSTPEPYLRPVFRSTWPDENGILLEWATGGEFEIAITRYVFDDGLSGDCREEWSKKFAGNNAQYGEYYDTESLKRGFYYQYKITGEHGMYSFSDIILFGDIRQVPHE